MKVLSNNFIERKRIVILTYGTRGDVEPFIALGVRLIQLGHSVCLVGPGNFKNLVESNSLDFEAINATEELGQLLADKAGGNWIRMIREMTSHVVPLAMDVIQTIEKVVRDADLIIHSFLMTDAGHTMAIKYGIKDISAQFFPIFLPTNEFSAVGLPDLPLGNLYRSGSHALSTSIFRYLPRIMYSRLKKSSPELPELAPWLLSGSVEKRTPILFAYSKSVLPVPNDWPENAHVTGYWQLQPPSDWEPPRELIQFLDDGPPPIYFGPGSMQSKKSNKLLDLIIRASQKTGHRLVIGADPKGLPEKFNKNNMIFTKGVPHAWLFPRMSFIIHHGGAGTCGAALSAGVPNAAIPFAADQFFWADRLSKLKVGPTAPPLRSWTEIKMIEFFEKGTSNTLYKENVTEISNKINNENGIENAVSIIQTFL